jgi:hypothetical protein
MVRKKYMFKRKKSFRVIELRNYFLFSNGVCTQGLMLGWQVLLPLEPLHREVLIFNKYLLSYKCTNWHPFASQNPAGN